jgi:hypothetical protein
MSRGSKRFETKKRVRNHVSKPGGKGKSVGKSKKTT